MSGDVTAGRALEANAPDAPPADSPTWRRTHWASPLVRGWISLLAFAFIFGREFFQDGGKDFHPGDILQAITGADVKVLLIALGVLLLVLVLPYAKWFTTRFCITEDHIYLTTGILSRSQQQLRLDRIQGIDINQPLLARLLGLAELTFETADGTGDEAFRLSFLTSREAAALRHDLLVAAEEEHDDDAAAPLSESAVPAAGEAAPMSEAVLTGEPVKRGEAASVDRGPAETIFQIPAGRAIGAFLLGGTVMYLLVYVAVMLVLGLLPFGWAVDISAGMGVALLPQLIGLGFGALGRLPKQMGFTISRRGNRLVLSQGLASTTAKSLRLERIHAVKIEQPILWRPLGWYRLSVMLPGDDIKSEDAVGANLVPVGTFEEVRRVLEAAAPALAAHTDGFLPREGDGFIRVLPRLRWLSPFQFPRLGYRLEGGCIQSRGGWLSRKLFIAPIRRAQSVTLNQGPLQRALGVASVRPNYIKSWNIAETADLTVADAERLYAELSGAVLEAAHAAILPHTGQPAAGEAASSSL